MSLPMVSQRQLQVGQLVQYNPFTQGIRYKLLENGSPAVENSPNKAFTNERRITSKNHDFNVYNVEGMNTNYYSPDMLLIKGEDYDE